MTSSGTQESCTFTFKRNVEAIKASDYDSKPELKGAQLIRRVDFEVNKLGVIDRHRQGARPHRHLNLTGKAFDATIFTKEDLSKTPPYTKPVEGAPIDALKEKVQAKQDIIIPVEVVVVVKLARRRPRE